MKNLKYYLMAAFVSTALLNACDDDDMIPGNPVMDATAVTTSGALFGDSLSFTIKATDVDVPLSTLKAQLYFSDQMVSETVIRTKTSGQDYTGKIFVPFYANVPNGTATLKFILQNINFTTSELTYDLPLSRPDFPYLTLVTDSKEYKMEKVGENEYAVTSKFAAKVKGYIVAPAVGANGNEITFGWADGGAKEGTTNKITYSELVPGKYTISFNTLTYETGPFAKMLIDGTELTMIDGEKSYIDLNLTQGQTLEVKIPDTFWIDPDFFTKNADGTLTFLPISGSYRIIANTALNYLEVLRWDNGGPMTLGDGSGALWIIGDGIGKPDLSTNQVGWTTEKGLCMAQITDKIHQITVVTGQQMTNKPDKFNFKFFHQQGWGGEYKNETLTSKSDLIFIGDGSNGRDAGNLGLNQELEVNTIYRIIVDLTAGVDKAVLDLEKVGEYTPEAVVLKINGTTMQADESGINHTLDLDLAQGDAMTLDVPNDYWIDPDYFGESEEGGLKFLPVSGKYRFIGHTGQKYIEVLRLDGDSPMTLGDGSGALWIIGDGIGKPSLTNTVGWTTEKGLCMVQLTEKVHQITVVAGEQISATDINFKFFHQQGWGGEYKNETLTSNSDLIFVGNGENGRDAGNLGLSSALEDGATYRIIVDVTAGIDNAVLNVEKVEESE